MMEHYFLFEDMPAHEASWFINEVQRVSELRTMYENDVVKWPEAKIQSEGAFK